MMWDTTGQRLLTATGKWEDLIGTKKLAFCYSISGSANTRSEMNQNLYGVK